MHGGDDGDDIFGMAGRDTLYGDAGADRIAGDGEAGGEVLTVTEQHGNDLLSGGAGNDKLFAAANEPQFSRVA